jgi:putative endonuclease
MHEERTAFVYIMSNDWRVLYTGITTDLATRVAQHKNGHYSDSFTSRYRLSKLVYFEIFGSIMAAIAREKQIKGWRRIRKLELIVEANPLWKDLSLEWGKPTEPFDEAAFQRRRATLLKVLKGVS